MNCQLFETVVNDLARPGVMDARARDSALAHSEACERCAARLRDERMLTAGLGRVAATAEAKEAPARVESALLAAFREQHSSHEQHSSGGQDLSDDQLLSGGQRSSRPAHVINQSQTRRWTRRALATAATILILLALAALRLDHSSSGPSENAGVAKPEQPVATPAPVPSEAAPNIRDVHSPQVAVLNKPQPAQRPRRAARNSKDGKDRVEPKPQAGGTEVAEIATEFIPLVHGSNMNSMESGQVVRVELPRSALMSFGFPMNMERANERIKADVVLGNDGLARAIRFVR